MEEGLRLGADCEPSVEDEDVVDVQEDVLTIKLERALHNEHVDANVEVEEDLLTALDPHAVELLRADTRNG